MGKKRRLNGIRVALTGILLILVAVLILACFACAKAEPTPTPRGSYDTATPVPGATPTPRPTPWPTGPPEKANGAGDESEQGSIQPASYEPGSGTPTGRIIVRTVDTTLVVGDVSWAIENIGSLAVQMGGWVVSTNQLYKHSGAISIRVPAERLDEALRYLRDLATKVESEISTSQDFTDEYMDTQARVRNLQATEEALIGFLDKAENVEEALKVQVELTKVQEDIEKLQGRLGFLEQSSAFSLIQIELKLASMDMQVDGGPDLTVKEGSSVSFRASFVPPEGITDFKFEWDFGDGSGPSTGTRTAPELDGISRITSTVTHSYNDSRDSPFIVTVSITGSGDAGVAEGEDTLIATVVTMDPIEVYAGQDMSVVEGETVTFDGSFTRPEGLTDFQFRWEFGDGSAPVTGSVSEDGTNATATHMYSNYRPTAFNATLTITADSEAGPIEASGTISVTVDKAGAWAGPWSPSNTFKSAVRALTATGQVIGRAAIWLAILSPIWGGVLFVVVFLSRRRRARLKRMIMGDDDF